MGSITNRPYAGTWAPNRMDLVQHTPDCIVYLNGDTSIAGCAGCNRRINFQQFITSVSVEASTDPSGHSSSITMSVPKHHGQSMFTDGGSVIRVGLEVHVYMRGYFPVQGLNPGEVAGISTTDIPTYPYYHVFHGVITAVDYEYSSGFWSLSASCSSMLHFWSYIDITESGSVFGARPSNSQVNTTLRGHNFNGMSPFAIMYHLYQNDTGASSGVGYALSSESNNSAVSASGDSLFSLVTQYWERRFGSRMYGLRMHGASGQLFTAAQQSFLSRMRSGQIERILTTNFRASSSESAMGNNPFLQTAEALGFLRRDTEGNIVGALDLLQQEIATEDGGLGFNIAAMQAFVQDIGQLGNVNLFESTYQSKLDIASEVSRVTGYEFFQDVDGDLVFKPPLYNLDTASSRVYRIEPIDIISISFAEAEPEATYMIVKGGQFRNTTGLGMDGEFGVRGNYVDYRLVAQFGWRPTDMETNYYNSARTAFFAAVSQLDIINAKVLNTLSVTIPYRPELRPGYPIYIVDIDTYYYLDSFSHGFQFGGQCTTSIVASARRKKFNAPGNLREDGIFSIDLSNTLLPPKTLQTVDNNGNPRSVGFPNVVMALDPNQLNPLFLYTAVSSEDIDDPEILRLLIRQAVALGVLTPSADADENGPWEFSVDATTTMQLPPIPSVTSLVDMAQAIRAIEEQVAESTAEIQKQDIPEGEGEERDRAIAEQTQAIAEQREILEVGWEGAEALTQLIERTRKAFSEGDDFPNPDSTLATLSLISDRKASFSNGSTPGSYRYYSSSHPDPEMQGMREFVQNPGGLEIRNLFSLLENDRPPKGFSPVVGGVPPGASPRNYVEIDEEASVEGGLRVLRLGNREEILPTHKIDSLSFASHALTRDASFSNRTGGAYTFNVDRVELSKAIEDNIREQVSLDDVDPASTPIDLFEPVLNVFTVFARWTTEVPVLATSTVNDPVTFGTFVESNMRFDERRDQTFQAIADEEGIQLDMAVNLMLGQQSRMLADWIISAYEPLVVEFTEPVVSDELSRREYEAIIRQYNQDSFAVAGSVIGDVPSVTDFAFPAEVSERYQTPVFPVSDAEGYEVVGSYRYGRGLFIEPGANYSQLMELDPLRFADPEVLDEFVAARLSNNEDRLNEAERELVDNLNANPTAGPGVDVLLSHVGQFPAESERTDILQQGLRNFIASDQDSIHKLPVANAAFALADLVPDTVDTEVCSCRGALSDIRIQALAADTSTFISIDDPPDRITAWASEQAILAGGPWRERQEALRGTVTARRNPVNRDNSPSSSPLNLSSIAENFNALRNVPASQDVQEATNALQDSVQNAADAFEDI